MLFCLLEYLQMLEHKENIWEKNASLFLTMKEGGGGASFFSWLQVYRGAGEIVSQLWRNFQLARV